MSPLKLASWTEGPEPAIRSFSGTTACRTTFIASEIRGRAVLDLGRAPESSAGLRMLGSWAFLLHWGDDVGPK